MVLSVHPRERVRYSRAYGNTLPHLRYDKSYALFSHGQIPRSLLLSAATACTVFCNRALRALRPYEKASAQAVLLRYSNACRIYSRLDNSGSVFRLERIDIDSCAPSYICTQIFERYSYDEK